MLGNALSLFTLHRLPLDRFTFPRWQSVLAITVIGLLVGFDPNMRVAAPELPPLPLSAVMPVALSLVWMGFLAIVAFLRWWMKRGGRWDGQGSLFNLVAAAWLVTNVLGAGLVAIGVSPLLTLPLWLYSIWVGVNALSGAIPKASRRYSFAGIMLSLIPAMLASTLVMILGGVLMAALGVFPEPPALGMPVPVG